MPSASSNSEKPALTEASDSLKQAIVIIEHRIRNLEKRKSKLDAYKEGVKSLTKEQVAAIAKYDEVVQQLELSKEYAKQFTLISAENEKLKKKQEKKDAQEKYAAELNKVKQILQIQDLLQCMKNEKVRLDFLGGLNGAIQLTEADLKVFDDLWIEVSPNHFSRNGSSCLNDQFQKAAELLMVIIEGKPKEVVGSTGVKLRDLVTSIQNSGYFEKTQEEENDEPVEDFEDKIIVENNNFQENKEIINNLIVPNQNAAEGNHTQVQNPGSVQPIVAGAPVLPVAGGQPPLIQPTQQPLIPPNVTNIIPTPVSQVESSFFNAQGFKPPAPQTVPPSNQSTRQINDVIQSVAGKFNFLQESELEIADINSGVVQGNPPLPTPQIPGTAPTIPTQTFTNQNFNGQPANAPAYPPNYPPQPAAFQPFVPAFPTFVVSNPSTVQNTNTNTNSVNPPTATPVNTSANPNVPTSSSNLSNSNNKCNNIPNPIPMTSNRNPTVNYNQGQQQLSSGYTNQVNKQNLSQTVNQSTFQHANISVGAVENSKIEDAVRGENEMKEKQENEKQDWSQAESTSWADEWTETSEWNSSGQSQPDGTLSSNKYSSGRANRNAGTVPRNINGYQGNRNRVSRPGGYRDVQNSQSSGSNNYFQNQNGYQSRNDRNNDYSIGKGMDLRENSFKERGDFNNRDRDSFGGGFKRGPNSRGPNMKGPLDRGDRSMQVPRNNTGGPRIPRNTTRQPGGRNGPSYQRQHQNPIGQTITK